MNVALLLATYNGDKYLSVQLDSLLKQTYTDFTIYISDDCSSDNTRNVIKSYIERYPEKIVLVENNYHFGNARDNFFYLLNKIDSECYIFCDQDDFWLPEKIEKLIQHYENNKSNEIPVLIHSDLKVVDSNLKEISNSFFESMNLTKNTDWHNLVVQNNVTGCTMLINKCLADYYKKNVPTIKLQNIIMHDYFFALIASLCGKTVFIDEPLILYRQHGNNSVGAKNVKSISYFMTKIKQIKTNKNLVKKTEVQVGEVLKILEQNGFINSEKLEILKKYSDLEKHNKFYRIIFLINHKMLKHGFIRKIYQFIAI